MKNSGTRQDLFDLVKTLTQGELKRLRESHALGDQKERMFQSLRKMDTFDQKLLREALPEASLNHIAVLKGQLYRKILEVLALTSAHAQNYPSGIRIAEIDFLTRRGLYYQAYDHICLSIEEAKELEGLETLKRLYPLKWDLEASYNIPTLGEAMAEERRFHKSVIQAVILDAQLNELHSELRDVKRLPTSQHKFAVDGILSSLSSLASSSFTRPTLARHNIEFLAARILNDRRGAEIAAQATFNAFLQNKGLLSDPEMRDWFFKSAQAKILHFIYRRDIDEAKSQMSHLVVLAKNIGVTEANELNFKAIFAYLEISLALVRIDRHQGFLVVKDILVLCSSNEQLLRQRLFTPVITLALLFAFIHADYDLAIQLSSKAVTANTQTESSKESFVASHLFRLATFLDMGHFDSIEKVLPETKASMKARGTWSDYEQRMVSFFADILKNSLPQNVKKQMLSLKKDLDLLLQDPTYWKHKEIFPVMHWLQACLEQKPLAELYISSPQ